ncbi:cAMP-binding domain of CRP or a regulatory subunit of cAMP-dependent protein kinases [Paenimyroides ummariense]|uniref:cAMP-binding domain of CRP or a regulatory subunit of cAMP-dependent protein kinases n=1 Tax=Paenimyroides ummariense TaxID=913024 RepID=A0A1I5F6K6_9FLAO|nr:Crp/Fnr family transcriptional regulator [Paenimyroides ummariense]SFO18961.1 cAMP-binding domain of CRP or a regulatory subunit of cAMP-dependent protein kinases [Paenimyroides ummariense]
MIKVDLILNCGGTLRNVVKNELIFKAGHFPSYYYQVVEGKVKMNNYSEDGKEFIQEIFTAGRSFGEPPLFINEPYPANAIAISAGVVVQIKKSLFDEMLYKYPEVSVEINRSLARRLYYKAIMAPELSSQNPEKRLLKLLHYLKEQSGTKTDFFVVELSRQQLADLTGLRVETVIRTIKHLEKQGYLKIIEGKIYLE